MMEINEEEELKELEEKILEYSKQITHYSKLDLNKEMKFTSIQRNAENIIKEIAKWRYLNQMMWKD